MPSVMRSSGMAEKLRRRVFSWPPHGKEGLARDKGHALLEAALEKHARVQSLRELDPQEETASGPRITDILREVRFQGHEHGVAAASIDITDSCNVRFEIVFEHEARREELDEARSVEVGALLDEHVSPQEITVRHHPTEAHARRQDLRKGPEVHHRAFITERRDRRQRLAVEAELGVRCVLDHRHIETACKLGEFAAAFDRPTAPARVLEIRHDVDELDPIHRIETRFELRRHHAVVIGRHLDEGRPVGAKGADGAEVGRALAEDNVALVEKDLAGQVEGLLRTADDEHLVGGTPQPQSLCSRSAISSRSTFSPSVGAYCNARTPSSSNRSRARSASSAAGRSSDAGRPPAKEMTSGCCVTLRISRMSEARKSCMREAKRR